MAQEIPVLVHSPRVSGSARQDLIPRCYSLAVQLLGMAAFTPASGVWRIFAERNPYTRKRLIILVSMVTVLWWLISWLYPVYEPYAGFLWAPPVFPSLHVSGTVTFFLILLLLLIFLAWRFVRPLDIFVITDAFDRPEDTSVVPEILDNLNAGMCASCHRDFYEEWQTTIHSQAWTDPYFQTDWKFDNSQHVCRNCHTPLDRQQPHVILGFRDTEK